MARKTTIVICMNPGSNADHIQQVLCGLSDFDIKIFTCFKDLVSLNDKALRAIHGFVVLCELDWDHELSGNGGSLWKGVGLVQGYLRSKKSLNVPIIFVSYSASFSIIKDEPGASIILTPALQHQFVRLPVSDFKKEVLGLFKEMRPMTTLEQRYTKQLYCDCEGMLHRIKHNVGGTDNDTLKTQIVYVIDKCFSYEKERLIKKLEGSGTDLKVFCQELLDMMDNGRQTDNTINPEFVCSSGSSQIKTLLLEDNKDDKYINRFVEYIRNKNQVYQEQNKVYLFEEPRVVRDEKTFDSKFKRIKFEVVICDIEIKDEEGKLNSLGFNIIENKVNKGYTRPLYYIVTNVTRSFYDQIKIPRVNRIRLKEEVFGSDLEIERLLYGIKEVVQHKEQEMDDPQKYLKVWEILDNYVRNPENYPFVFKNKTKFGIDCFDSFDELDFCVNTKSLDLIKQFLILINQKSAEYYPARIKIKKEYDHICEDMRMIIKRGITCGNEEFVRHFDFGQSIKPDDIEKFVIRLILRRFFLYLIEFIKFVDLESHYSENLKLNAKDIACRAISKQFKRIDEFQSKCLNYTLLYSPEKNDDLQQTQEEKAFVTAIKAKGEDAFDFDDEDLIDQLCF